MFQPERSAAINLNLGFLRKVGQKFLFCTPKEQYGCLTKDTRSDRSLILALHLNTKLLQTTSDLNLYLILRFLKLYCS